MQTLSALINNALFVSILVIIFSSLVAFYASTRSRDRCLRDFDRYLVTVEDQKDEVAWGTLYVYSSGVELRYRTEHHDVEGHVENSYIFYASELANLRTLYRFHDDQSRKDQERRRLDIQRTYQPSIFRRARRALRNLISTFKDAIVQALNTILSYRAAQTSQSVLLGKGQAFTTGGAQLWTSVVGNAYEPILEHYIGQYVVVEIGTDEIVEEYGILKEYSARYLELLNVKLEVPLQLYVKGPQSDDPPPVQLHSLGGTLQVTNNLDRDVLIEVVSSDDQVSLDPLLVESKQSARIVLQEGQIADSAHLDIHVHCLADIIVPRTLATVRHAGKREKLSWEAWLGIDDLSYLPWVRELIDKTVHRRPKPLP